MVIKVPVPVLILLAAEAPASLSKMLTVAPVWFSTINTWPLGAAVMPLRPVKLALVRRTIPKPKSPLPSVAVAPVAVLSLVTPATKFCRVLLLRVSIVALPTKVSVAAGAVKVFVPSGVNDAILTPVAVSVESRVLFLSVALVLLVTKLSPAPTLGTLKVWLVV